MYAFIVVAANLNTFTAVAGIFNMFIVAAANFNVFIVVAGNFNTFQHRNVVVVVQHLQQTALLSTYVTQLPTSL